MDAGETIMVAPTYVNQSINLWQLMVNDISSGNETVFILLSLLVITLILAKMRVPNLVAISIYVVYGLLMGAFFPTILTITLVVIGIILSATLLRFIHF